MANSTLNITGSKTGLPGGSKTISLSAITNNSAPDQYDVKAFVGGTFQAVTVPTGAVGVIIMPPATNVGTITLKGITGDTGVTLHKTNPTPLSLDSGASFGLLCSASITLEFEWI